MVIETLKLMFFVTATVIVGLIIVPILLGLFAYSLDKDNVKDILKTRKHRDKITTETENGTVITRSRFTKR